MLPAVSDATIIRAGRLVDVLAEKVLIDHEVVVRGDRIGSVRPAGEPAPDGARVIDLSDCTVLPGLFDCHAHLAGRAEDGSEYSSLLVRTAAQEVLAGVANARDTLMAGFTSVRDVGTFRALSDVALRDAIEKGWVVGPRMTCAGAYVTVSTGGGAITGVPPDLEIPRELRFGVANSVDEVRQRVREILTGGADFIKVIATGAVMTEGTNPAAPEFSEAEIRAAVEEAALYDTHVAAHAHGAEGIKRAVRAGVRSIEHGSLMDDEAIEMMAEHGTYLVADIYDGDYIASAGRRFGWSEERLRKNDETTEAQREGFRKCVRRGVKIAYGTDSGIYPHADVAKQMPYMVKYGMTPMQAVRAATIVAAELLGRQDRVGSITEGKLADVVAIPGDALDDLERFMDVSFVMKGGVVVKADGRSTAL